MSRYVDLNEKIIAQFYDQEREEWTIQTVTIEDVLNNVCDEYTVLPSAQPGWIPCSSERFPEEGERVLATHLGGINPNNQVIEHIYQHGKFICGWDMDTNVDSPTFGQRYMGKVIAWMPLPKPYREDYEMKLNQY